MSVLPPKRHPVLVVHAHAVATRSVTPQQFEPIASRHGQIVQATRRVNQSELPLRRAPQLAWNSPSRTGVSFAEQIS
jgi:predicted signal transduction protein with EAL and GGDEF domain